MLAEQETIGRDIETNKTAVSHNEMIALKGLGVFDDEKYIVYGEKDTIYE